MAGLALLAAVSRTSRPVHRAMLVHPLCRRGPSWSPTSRPVHRAMLVHPLCRRGLSSSPTIKMQQARKRDAFRSHCEKRADRLGEPEPENHDPDKAATSKNCPLVEERTNYLDALLAAMGVRVPPDMFIKEKEQISDYMMKLSGSADGRNLDERVTAKIVCRRAQGALDLASKVMDIAREGSGGKDFSQRTTDQMVRTYGTILCNVAGDAYHKKIKTESTISFFDALRGLGRICHILVQDTVSKLKDDHLKNEITRHMDTHSQEFCKKLKNMEDEVATTEEQMFQRMVTTILFYALEHAHSYIFRLTEGRKLVLDYLTRRDNKMRMRSLISFA